MFIPKNLRVGFQKREDTFTKNLGYVTYIDELGKLRQENSWEGWRDKTIPILEIENKPKSGFVMNKGVTRWGHWNSSGRDKIRIWDPDGFEVEISVDNLLELQSFYDVSKKEILGECVYAWSNKNLVLLPTISPEYKELWATSRKQGNKIGLRELVEGGVYEKKATSEQVVFVGKRLITGISDDRWSPRPVLGKQVVERVVLDYPIGLEANMSALAVKELSHLVATLSKEELENVKSLAANSVMAGLPHRITSIPFPESWAKFFVDNQEDPTLTPPSWRDYGYWHSSKTYAGLRPVSDQCALLASAGEALGGAFFRDYAQHRPRVPAFLWKRKDTDVLVGLLYGGGGERSSWSRYIESVPIEDLVVAEYTQNPNTLINADKTLAFMSQTTQRAETLAKKYPKIKSARAIWELMQEEYELPVLQMHNGAQTLLFPVMGSLWREGK